ncbi:hypothetical protein ABPG75_004606 [Micractinium tetrahymenae]
MPGKVASICLAVFAVLALLGLYSAGIMVYIKGRETGVRADMEQRMEQQQLLSDFRLRSLQQQYEAEFEKAVNQRVWQAMNEYMTLAPLGLASASQRAQSAGQGQGPAALPDHSIAAVQQAVKDLQRSTKKPERKLELLGQQQTAARDAAATSSAAQQQAVEEQQASTAALAGLLANETARADNSTAQLQDAVASLGVSLEALANQTAQQANATAQQVEAAAQAGADLRASFDALANQTAQLASATARQQQVAEEQQASIAALAAENALLRQQLVEVNATAASKIAQFEQALAALHAAAADRQVDSPAGNAARLWRQLAA